MPENGPYSAGGFNPSALNRAKSLLGATSIFSILSRLTSVQVLWRRRRKQGRWPLEAPFVRFRVLIAATRRAGVENTSLVE